MLYLHKLHKNIYMHPLLHIGYIAYNVCLLFIYLFSVLGLKASRERGYQVKTDLIGLTTHAVLFKLQNEINKEVIIWPPLVSIFKCAPLHFIFSCFPVFLLSVVLECREPAVVMATRHVAVYGRLLVSRIARSGSKLKHRVQFKLPKTLTSLSNKKISQRDFAEESGTTQFPCIFMTAAVKQGQNRTDIHVCEKSLHPCASSLSFPEDALRSRTKVGPPHLTGSWS